jgi:hypothetical protein
MLKQIIIKRHFIPTEHSTYYQIYSILLDRGEGTIYRLMAGRQSKKRLISDLKVSISAVVSPCFLCMWTRGYFSWDKATIT